MMGLSVTFYPLQDLASKSGAADLRAEFLDGQSDVDIGGGTSVYDESKDALVGCYVNLEEEYGPVGCFDFELPFSEFAANKAARLGKRIVDQFKEDLIRHGPKGSPQVLRLYDAELSRCEASVLLEHEPEAGKVIRDSLLALRAELRQTEKSFRSPALPASSGNVGGRPLDKTADQERIYGIVWQLAALPRYQNADGSPKPTPIRDTLLREHSEVCGKLSESSVFKRVQMALSEGPPGK